MITIADVREAVPAFHGDRTILLVEVHQAIARGLVVQQLQHRSPVTLGRISNTVHRNVVAEGVPVVTCIGQTRGGTILNRSTLGSTPERSPAVSSIGS